MELRLKHVRTKPESVIACSCLTRWCGAAYTNTWAGALGSGHKVLLGSGDRLTGIGVGQPPRHYRARNGSDPAQGIPAAGVMHA